MEKTTDISFDYHFWLREVTLNLVLIKSIHRLPRMSVLFKRV